MNVGDAQLFRQARLAAGLSYREVGEAARLDQSAIAHYEAGRLRPSAQAAQRWRAGVRRLLGQRLKDIAQLFDQF